jgi:hypothetical protein
MLSNSLKSPAGEFPESILAFRLPLDHQEGSIFHACSDVVKKLEHTQSREETARVHIQKKRESAKSIMSISRSCNLHIPNLRRPR